MRLARLLLVVLLVLTGCGSNQQASNPPPSIDASGEVKNIAVPAPTKLTKPVRSPDLLVYSRQSLPKKWIRKISRMKEVRTSELLTKGAFFAEDRQIDIAAVNPDSFRRYTPRLTAQTLKIWQRVAGGEMVIAPAVAARIQDKSGNIRIGNDATDPLVHVGGYAPLAENVIGVNPHIQGIVNQRWAQLLKLPKHNAMLLTTGTTSPAKVAKKIRKVVGKKVAIQILSVNLDINSVQTAVVTGGDVASAIGTFTYTANADGSVNPESSWVANNIVSEVVPILGTVTCHKVMIKQLRSALLEVVKKGLTNKIYQYGGCYNPRYIARNQSQGLSYHTFGTAIDLNVQENLRGTAGKIDRRVVEIFEKWGFAWGGYWGYTDPMHFELARLVSNG